MSNSLITSFPAGPMIPSSSSSICQCWFAEFELERTETDSLGWDVMFSWPDMISPIVRSPVGDVVGSVIHTTEMIELTRTRNIRSLRKTGCVERTYALPPSQYGFAPFVVKLHSW